MGKTAFSGPAYGAKSLLWSVYVPVGTSGATITGAVTQVPAYEDWYATETFFACSSCSTGAAASSVTSFSITDDSTALHAAVTLVSTASGVLTTVTPDAGEYEGKRIAGGSTLAFVIAGGSSCVASGSARAELRGYIRWVNSTRSEG